MKPWLFLARFGRKRSKEQAKERLELVMMQDRILGEGNLPALREDLLTTMERHFAIKREHIEILLRREGRTIAVVANIPMESPHTMTIRKENK